MAMKIPPRGNIIWFVKKSVASKKFFPKIVNSERRLNERALKSPINHATKPNKAVAVILFIFKDSISHATPGSIRDIEELNAAILNSTKNRVPKNTPKGIELKAIGKVTKQDQALLTELDHWQKLLERLLYRPIRQLLYQGQPLI